MIFEIKHKWTGVVLYSCEANNIKEAVVQAVGKKADLKGADLRWAYLQGADLKGAVLQGADLRWAYLRWAYLQGADLKGADLQVAFLQGADLRWAYLQGADLKGAYLRWAYLQGADLKGAFLQGADLQGAFLQGADLQGAFLQGADLQENLKIKAGCAVLIFSGGGSVGRDVFAFNCETGIYVQAGCFFGDLNEFRAKVLQDENGDKTIKKSLQYLGFANIAAISFDKPEDVQT